jgi:D-lactate dehydrogenase (cytochrome)
VITYCLDSNDYLKLTFWNLGTPAGVKEQIALVRAIGKNHKSKSFEFSKNKEEARDLWSARKEALWSVMALKRTEDDQ